MQYIALDPRPQVKDQELNKLREHRLMGDYLLGLEVTIAAFTEMLDWNIDPQHSEQSSNHSCISKVAEIIADPSKGFFPGVPRMPILVTVRPDCDSIGASALIAKYGDRGVQIPAFVMERVQQIHLADTARTDRWKPSTLFSDSTPGFEHSRDLGPIARAIADFKVPLEDRVQWMAEWLEAGTEPKGYREAWEKERLEIQRALEARETVVEPHGAVTIVKSRLRSATSIGYQTAPVLVCYNPEFAMGGGKPHLKFSVCQYAEGYVDLPSVLADLKAKEAGWGGSATFIGSTQGEGSVFSPAEVLEIVQKHLI